MEKTIDHWISGTLVKGSSGRTSPVHNPAKGEVTALVNLASLSEVDTVVADSLRASRDWKRSTLSRRAATVFKFHELLAARSDELAAIVTAEHGKVLADAAGEIARGLENVEFATGVPQMMKGGYSEGVSTGVDVYSIRQPLGVVAGITPFNFPVMVPLWMCANAIATGNTFILKPSEKDPSASLFLAQLWRDAGLPDGVFNVLQGDKIAVDGLLAHPDVSAVSFVGSTPIARYIYVTGTSAGKRIQALGGAKNHMVVLPDADIDTAADAAVSAGYGAAGERCMAISVVVAVGSIADSLVEAIAARIPKLVVGDGAAKGTDMGPLITGEHRDKVASYVNAGENAGAVVVVDGRTTSVPVEGYFLGPTLLDQVTREMSVYEDEIFGPVLSVVRCDTLEEAIDLINANKFANGTAIFTRDGGAARQFQTEIEVGMIGINVPIPIPVSYYSFGGWKASLFGDSHMYGPEGVAFYTRGKVVTSRWPNPATSEIDLGFPQVR
jgi:malonate-semialdehyde dehydrogenase (acetylating)/methylmalonate-semialdehyde dehydrogenase